MRLRVNSWWHVIAYSALITAFAVLVPVSVVAVLFWWLPPVIRFSILLTAGLIPLFIAFPIAFFGLYMLKLMHGMINTLDNHVKYDNLTGLLSRGYFLSTIEQQRADGGQMVLIDADHFKAINDTYGHDQGDEALKFIARTILRILGKAGIAGRLGGEEFAVYLPGAGRQQAALFASGLGAALRSTPLRLAGDERRITASMGIVNDAQKVDISAILKMADICLYKAKTRGRDCYVCDDGLADTELVMPALASVC